MSSSSEEGGKWPFNAARRQWPPDSMAGRGLGGIAIVTVILAGAIFWWFFCRIEPDAGEMAVLIRKTGKDLPSGQIIATEPGQKGIQLEVMAEGRKFKDPYNWDWIYAKSTDVPAGRLAVLTRMYGKDLPAGEILAPDDLTKGVVKDVLKPGKYRINPYAYHVELYNAVNVRAGHVGVVASMIGKDMLNSTLAPEDKNGFLVKDGMKGVLAEIKSPGTYYMNPFMYEVVEVSLQSQRFAVSDADAISFLTMDGFTVIVEGTIEFAVDSDKAALVTHRIGDMDDIVQKLILPQMRGFCRVEGSKHPAVTFIVGQTRQKFQSDLEQHLRKTCDVSGISIKSVLIRNIKPPDAIASIIRDREVAVQESKRYDQEIKTSKSKAELVKQEMLAQQNKEKVEADTGRIRAVINAEQEQAVRIVAAKKEMEVARIEKEAADAQAKSLILKAEADSDVIRMKNLAEAEVVKSQVKAFGSGLTLARNAFYKKIGPMVRSILSTDQEPGLGGLFGPFIPERKEVK